MQMHRFSKPRSRTVRVFTGQSSGKLYDGYTIYSTDMKFQICEEYICELISIIVRETIAFVFFAYNSNPIRDIETRISEIL